MGKDVVSAGFHCAVWLCIATAIGAVASKPANSAEDIGIAPISVGPGPFTFDTAEQHDIRVDILARGLAHAYSVAFLPNADALLVERGSRLRLIRAITTAEPVLVEKPVVGTPDFAGAEHSGPDDILGIQDVAIHPEFSKNHLVYYTYNRRVGVDSANKHLRVAAVLARARLEGMRLIDSEDLLVGEGVEESGGSRILFGKGNLVYVSVGNTTHSDDAAAQRTDNIYGKFLRVRDDGSIPDDNPFVALPGVRREIFSLGFRDPQGITVDPRSGNLIASDHGPQGGDEINHILPGRNYGWPQYTYGTDYEGSPLPTVPVGPGTEPPLMVWMPDIAPSVGRSVTPEH